MDADDGYKDYEDDDGRKEDSAQSESGDENEIDPSHSRQSDPTGIPNYHEDDAVTHPNEATGKRDPYNEQEAEAEGEDLGEEVDKEKLCVTEDSSFDDVECLGQFRTWGHGRGVRPVRIC